MDLSIGVSLENKIKKIEFNALAIKDSLSKLYDNNSILILQNLEKKEYIRMECRPKPGKIITLNIDDDKIHMRMNYGNYTKPFNKNYQYPSEIDLFINDFKMNVAWESSWF